MNLDCILIRQDKEKLKIALEEEATDEVNSTTKEKRSDNNRSGAKNHTSTTPNVHSYRTLTENLTASHTWLLLPKPSVSE